MNDLLKQESHLFKLVRLNWRRKKSLLDAFAVMATYKLLLSFLPFRYFIAPKETLALRAEADTTDRLNDVIWAINVISSRIPLGFTCLTQALSAKWLLKKNYNLQLHIGVSKSAGQHFSAHAWIKHHDQIILGEQKNQVFEPILQWK